MSVKEKIQEIMSQTINQSASELGHSETFDFSPDVVLFGAGAIIDSLTLVSFIVDLEGNLSDFFEKEISLTDDRAMTREISPFETLGALKDYIIEIIEKNN